MVDDAKVTTFRHVKRLTAAVLAPSLRRNSLLETSFKQKNGGFQRWGYPNSWMVYNRKNIQRQCDTVLPTKNLNQQKNPADYWTTSGLTKSIALRVPQWSVLILFKALPKFRVASSDSFSRGGTLRTAAFHWDWVMEVINPPNITTQYEKTLGNGLVEGQTSDWDDRFDPIGLSTVFFWKYAWLMLDGKSTYLYLQIDDFWLARRDDQRVPLLVSGRLHLCFTLM